MKSDELLNETSWLHHVLLNCFSELQWAPGRWVHYVIRRAHNDPVILNIECEVKNPTSTITGCRPTNVPIVTKQGH